LSPECCTRCRSLRNTVAATSPRLLVRVMRLPILLLAHIATAHRRDLDLTAKTGAGSNASSIAATALQNFTAVVQTHGSDRSVLSRAGLGIPGKLQRLALILAVLGGPLPAVEAKNMPIAFAAPGNKKAAISVPKPGIKFPWDKAEAAVPAKATAVKKGKAKLSEKNVGGKSLTQRVFEMDLFAPVSDQNDYGARRKKNLVANGQLAKKSYVPEGLTKAQYEKVRAQGAKKKKDNYDRNVAKAGKFQDYTEFYTKRGTDLKDNWRDVTNSHTMAKTKYDWQTGDDMAAGAKLETKKGKKGKKGTKA